MINGITTIAVEATKWAFRLGFIAAGIAATVILLNFAFGLVFVALNGNVLSDLFALVQLWLPFNLNSILSWLIVAVVFYVVYRLSVIAVNYVSRLTA